MNIDEVIDRVEINELINRYGRIPDSRAYDLVDEVFAEDAELVTPYFSKPVLRGVSEIRQEMRMVEMFEQTMHAFSNVTLTIEGDTAQGVLFCIATHIFDRGGKVKGELGIRYEDEYTRSPDGWRIFRRELFELWQDLRPIDPSFVQRAG